MNKEEWQEFWKYLLTESDKKHITIGGIHCWLAYEYDKWEARKQYGKED